jgi:hypothetical protein
VSLRRSNPSRDHNELDITNELMDRNVQTFRSDRPGTPDLMCFYRGRVWLVEVKSGNRPLTAAQKPYHAIAENCGVPVYILRSLEDIPIMMRYWDNVIWEERQP